jgi:aminoglycoside 3-N-acetyltransferase
MSFTSTDIEKSLSSLGLGNGDVLFCHSNLSLFGNMYECEDKEHYCKNFLDAILNVIGDDGTLIVPTYTYSFFNNQAYDSITSSHKMGIFAEYVRQHVSSRRNDDPCFSVSILGRLRNDFIACSSSDTFGPRSVYEKLIAEDGKIVNFNMGPSSALIHYVEKLNVVKYRSDRTFTY